MPTNLNIEPSANIGTSVLAWEFQEFTPLQRSKRWWLTASLVVIALCVYAMLTGNFLFALIILIGSILVVNETRREPRAMPCNLTSLGVRVGQKFWKWSELQTFWIAYHPPELKNLYIVPKNLFDPRVTIPLQTTNPLLVREHLGKFITEDTEREDEPTSEALTRLLKIR